MDGIERVYKESGDSAVARMPAEVRAPKAKKPKNNIDSVEVRAMHGKLVDWMQQERDRQSVNRFQMAVDEDFYDGLQWNEEDVAELNERNQAPLVFNKIKPSINWMLGTEKRTRFDYKILPREEGDVQAAEVKTKVFKYLSDCNRLPFERSQAFKEMIAAGLGWLEDGVNNEPGQEIIYAGAESWRNVLHDSMSVKLDFNQDGRYQFRWRWIDVDIAEAMFPDRINVLRSEAVDADQVAEKDEDIWYLGSRTNSEMSEFSRFARYRSVASQGAGGFNRRQRVKIIEGWYRVPVKCQIMRGGGALDGEIYDQKNPEHAAAVDREECTLASTTYLKMRVMLFTETHPLWDGDSPYKHNRFPLTPLWCYRRARDGMPYGMIRDVRDSQEDFNKRASKSLFILSTNRVMMEKGAIDAKDIERFRAEIARPDAIIEYATGKKLEVQQDKQLAEQHIMLMDRDAQMIQDISGITDENLGRPTNANSGIAIQRRQDQGGVVTASIFDNYRFAYQVQGEKLLSLIEQYFTAKKVLRIVGENKPIEWVPVNSKDEAGQPLNDITASRADFIVDEQDFRASLRQAQAESMMEMIGKIAPVMPQAAINLLDLVVDLWDMPNKEEWLSRIRSINGQRDPAKAPTPEDKARMAKAQALQDTQLQLTLDTAKANLDKLKGQGRKMDADTFKTIVTALYETLQAAQIVSTVPNVATVADVIATGAGFQPQGGTSPQIPEPSGAMPALTPQDKHGDFVGGPAGGGAPQDAGTTDLPPQPAQAGGAQQGIETVRNDGATAP
jgi:hypothetical protein